LQLESNATLLLNTFYHLSSHWWLHCGINQFAVDCYWRKSEI